MTREFVDKDKNRKKRKPRKKERDWKGRGGNGMRRSNNRFVHISDQQTCYAGASRFKLLLRPHPSDIL